MTGGWGDTLRLIEAMRRHSIFSSLAVQTVAEAHQVLIRKHHLNTREAQSRVQFWRPFSDLVPTDEAVFDAALELASNHHFQIYDAIILAAAVQVRCDLLLSEDMQDGFAWRGVTIANPFAATLEPRLARLLA
jgi:predicted nucleic acid-binding protein